MLPLSSAVLPVPGAGIGCKWWNLPWQGTSQVFDTGLSAITRATANGANQLLAEIVKTVDESTQVPLADPTYRDVYAGFLGLAARSSAGDVAVAVEPGDEQRQCAHLGRRSRPEDPCKRLSEW